MRFRPHQNWQFDQETIRNHFHMHQQQQKREELILCSDGVYRPEGMVKEFEESVKHLPMVITNVTVTL
jgi:hypothetical protein